MPNGFLTWGSDLYLKLLKQLVVEIEEHGKWYTPWRWVGADPRERAQAEYEDAQEMINLGVWGPALPHYAEILNYYRDWQQIETAAQKTQILTQGNVLVPGKVIEFQNRFYNPQGTPIFKGIAEAMIGEYLGTKEPSITPYQRGQLELARQRLGQDIREFETGQARWQEERGLAQQRFGLEREQFGLQREQTEWERGFAQQQLQAQYGGPSDWIKRWELAYGNAPQRQPSRLQEQASKGIWEIRQVTDLATQKREAAFEAFASGNAERGKALRQTATELTKLQRETEQAYEPAIQEQQALAQRGMETGVWPEAGGQPSVPSAPQWLPQFVPSQTAGQPITRAPTTTPSMQQWQGTPWSVREGLRGYTEWAGHRPYEDIMQSMYSMVPQTPRGAGGQRWTSRKQWG